MEKRPGEASRLSYRLFVRFLPEKQCLSPANNFNSLSVYDKKINKHDSPPDRDFRELSPRKQPQPPSLSMTESDSNQFIDSDYAIMYFSENNVTLSLSRFGGSGSPSLHIVTASIWL